MIKKAIVLAGGNGTRMSPLTKAVNKQLLPIYDKPLIFYPLSILMLSKIRDILIIVNKGQLDQFKKIIPDGENLGLNISFIEQAKAGGLPEAFILGEEFIKTDNVALILGDNFFYGQNFSEQLLNNKKLKKGAKIILHKVKKPELYGVAKLNNKKQVIGVREKPKKTYSDYAITGLYYFDNKVVNYSKKLKPSKRGEIEITDLIKIYLKKGKLTSDLLGRGGAWLDTGSIDDFYKTSNFVSSIENRQGLKIACLEEIALNNGWIKNRELLKAIKFYGKCNYSNYLKRLMNN